MTEQRPEETRITKEELQKIQTFIKEIRYGSVTVTVHDGRITQIEKSEKVRLNG